MKKRAKKVQTKFFKKRENIFWLAGVTSAICFFVFIIFAGHKHTTYYKIKPETEKNTMTKLPFDVKQLMRKQETTTHISAAISVPILMYHYVEYVQDQNDKERVLLNVNPDVFEKQIQTLLSSGYTIITAKDLGEILNGKKALPLKPVVITFDDGHWDLATDVLPIIKKYNVKITAYIVPGFIGTNSDSLSRKQMEEVVKSGLVDIGAHTVHHMSLKGKPFLITKYEVDESKAMLEREYHVQVDSFAYPYGELDQQAITIVKDDGFTTAMSTIAGGKQSNANRYFLYRVRPGYQTGEELISYLQYWDTIDKKLSYKK